MAETPAIYSADGLTYTAYAGHPLRQAAEDGKVHLSVLGRDAYHGRRLAKAELSGISSVGYWDAAGPQDWGLEWHRNEGIELSFLEAGKLPFALDDQNIMLKPGDLVVTRPWQLHCLGDPNVTASRLYWIIIDVNVRRPNQPWKWPKWLALTNDDVEELTNFLRHNERPVWPSTDDIRHCFKQIGKAVELDERGSHISWLMVYITELLLLTLKMIRQQDISLDPILSSSQRTVELFLRGLNENPETLGHPWTIEGMAAQCGLGKTRFRYHCKQLTNMLPMQYLNHCRVKMASKLLIERLDMSITNIAFECGFESSQYFATVFRQYKKCNPSNYRKNNHPSE